MCAGPAFTIGNAETGSSSARRHASISGSSGTQLAFRLQRIDPIRVSVRRGGVTEAIHRVHAVAVRDGAVIAEAGDSGLFAFMRSSSKPLQALPVARARADLDERDLAIASASHLVDDDQLAAVLNANSTDLSEFREHGGKLLMYHGWADPLIPSQSSINYFNALAKTEPGKGPDRDEVQQVDFRPGDGNKLGAHW